MIESQKRFIANLHNYKPTETLADQNKRLLIR